MVSKNRLVVVSNRLPFTVEKTGKGKWSVEKSTGGLVTAMVPVLQNRGGVWIGWPGDIGEDGIDVTKILNSNMKDTGYTLGPVLLTHEEVNKYYYGFSNQIIWPLFHDLQDICNFNPDYWMAYKEVNNKFAGVIHENTGRGDFIWVNDYHLMCVAEELRKKGFGPELGFFLHIPFPPLDIFVKLPWRFQVLRALLSYNMIGFQTHRDRRNFLQCVQTLLKDSDDTFEVAGKGQVYQARYNNREVRIGVFPIGIDSNDFAARAGSEEVLESVRRFKHALPARTIILGLDRQDYTKGIPYKLRAFRRALIKYPELKHKITLMQILVPSRDNIEAYHHLKMDIERIVGEINGEFTQFGWVPIHYIHRYLDDIELVSCYKVSDIALITPLKDGMNLVAKEYCACDTEEDGVLILSEFAGAATRFQKTAILVNPYDIESVADAIYNAYRMDEEIKKKNMKKQRKLVNDQDIFWWLDSFLNAAVAKDLSHFPVIEDYVPHV